MSGAHDGDCVMGMGTRKHVQVAFAVLETCFVTNSGQQLPMRKRAERRRVVVNSHRSAERVILKAHDE
jgi:hypothetical protein